MAVTCSCNEQNQSRQYLSAIIGDSVAITCATCCPPEDNVDWLAVQLAIESKDSKTLESLLKQTDEAFVRVSWANFETSQAQLDSDSDAIKDGI